MTTTFVVFIVLCVAALLTMQWQLMHHDAANCRVCQQRRAEERMRRADDGKMWQ